MERNLTRFNRDFQSLTERLEQRLLEVGNVYDSQLELLRTLQQIDVQKMATANVKVLSALDSSSKNLMGFARYMDETTEYLENVRALNRQLDEHLERTEALGAAADFYKAHGNELRNREARLAEAVASVDDTLKKALAAMTKNTEDAMRQMQQSFVCCDDLIRKAMENQKNAFGDKLRQLDAVTECIETLRPLGTVLQRLEAANNQQARALAKLNGTIDDLARSVRASRHSPGGTSPTMPALPSIKAWTDLLKKVDVRKIFNFRKK